MVYSEGIIFDGDIKWGYWKGYDEDIVGKFNADV